MIAYPVNEVVAKLTIGEKEYYLFPRYFGGTVVSAETIANGAVRGKEVTFQEVHAGTDRTSAVRKLNIRRVDFLDKVVAPVPESIVALYKAPDGETEEQELVRLQKIKDYFETR